MLSLIGCSRPATPPSPQLASGAADAVLGLSSTTDGAQTVLAKSVTLLPALLRLATTTPPVAATDAALGGLVNLSHDPAAAAGLRSLGAIPRLMDALRDDDGEDTAAHSSLRAERRLGLLANLTAEEAGAEALLGGPAASPAGTANLARLLGAFLSGGASTDAVAPLLTNLTRTPAGRALLLDSGGEAGGLAGGLAAAASQLLAGGASTTRRAGCAAALRNCCLAAAQAQAAVEEEEDADEEEEEEEKVCDPATAAAAAAALREGTARMGAVLSPAVLRPALIALCGNIAALNPGAEEGGPANPAPIPPPDADEDVREALAEAVLSLAGTAPGRAALWDVAAPEALRVAYVEEEGPYVCEAMEKTARLFLENATGGVEDEVVVE